LGNLTTPKRVQKLQMALHAKAKAEAGYRFYALYDKVSRCPSAVFFAAKQKRSDALRQTPSRGGYFQLSENVQV